MTFAGHHRPSDCTPAYRELSHGNPSPACGKAREALRLGFYYIDQRGPCPRWSEILQYYFLFARRAEAT